MTTSERVIYSPQGINARRVEATIIEKNAGRHMVQPDFNTASNVRLRQAAQISALISDLHRRDHLIEGDFAREEKDAGVFDLSSAAYPIMGRILRERHNNLGNTIAFLEGRLASLLEATEPSNPVLKTLRKPEEQAEKSLADRICGPVPAKSNLSRRRRPMSAARPASSSGGRLARSFTVKIINSQGIHVGEVRGAAIFDLGGQKLYALKGFNIYRLTGELVGHLPKTQDTERRLDRSADRLFPVTSRAAREQITKSQIVRNERKPTGERMVSL